MAASSSSRTEVAKAAPRDLTLHSSMEKTAPTPSHGLSPQPSAQIQIYAGDAPFLGLCWTFSTSELSLVLAGTKDVHLYGRDVDVDLLVRFAIDYVVRDRAAFPVTATCNFGHDKTFQDLAALETWLKIHIPLMKHMNHLWTGRDVAAADTAARPAAADADHPVAITSGMWQIQKMFHTNADTSHVPGIIHQNGMPSLPAGVSSRGSGDKSKIFY
eukprot:CAMPEP_0197428200 /NCGR_PEP_ID=MMETSP1170-20131217/40357_1 /TAXON_ID=54406 /ORGANISM="Sarcinochrysis sp, Strain CCMP770" /LENGTH=214 /DNA_ID=CAMNT_0042955933 /DNA_START=56 /DNA_END=701 /DNA_ORIENTATION=+